MARAVAAKLTADQRRAGRDEISVRVLLIEDDVELCRRIAGWLTDERLSVTAVTSGRAGAETGGREDFDVALVDLRLPDIGGTELVAALRAANARLQILTCSAFPDESLIEAATRAGAAEVLSKPLQPASLLQAVERAVAALGLPPRREPEFNRRLGARLRALRDERGLTQQELARRCGITAAQLSQIELGKTATTTWTLARLSGALRIRLQGVFENL